MVTGRPWPVHVNPAGTTLPDDRTHVNNGASWKCQQAASTVGFAPKLVGAARGTWEGTCTCVGYLQAPHNQRAGSLNTTLNTAASLHDMRFMIYQEVSWMPGNAGHACSPAQRKHARLPSASMPTCPAHLGSPVASHKCVYGTSARTRRHAQQLR